MEINGENLKEYLKAGGRIAKDTTLEICGELFSQERAKGFSEAYEIGIENAIMALYDANVNDKEIIRVVSEYWGIDNKEAEDRLIWEKSQIAIRELRKYLKLQGNSKEEIGRFMYDINAIPIIRYNKELWKLWKTPEKLIAAIQEIRQ